MTPKEEQQSSSVYFLEKIEAISNVIKRERDVEQLLWSVCGKILEIFECDRAWLLFPCDPQSPTWQVPIERTTVKYPGASLKNIPIDMTPDVADIFKTAIESDTPVIYGRGGYPLAENTKSFGVKSQMSMAIYPRIGRPWQFGIHQCSFERSWKAVETKLFHIIGVMTGEALGNLLFSRDLQKINIDLEQQVLDRTSELQQSLEEIRTLRGIIPICSYCKSIRDDVDVWYRLEEYLTKFSDATFSHGICPHCYDQLEKEFD